MQRHLGHDPLGNRLQLSDVDWKDDCSDSPRFAVGTVEMDKISPAKLDEHADRLVEIVHDFRNPLSTISLELCLLGELLAETGCAGADSLIGRVQHNVAYIDRLVQDILDSCALDANVLQLHRRPTEIQALIEHVVDRAVPSRDHARVVIRAGKRVNATIDALRIERVIANLVHNALKYAPNTDIVIQLEVDSRIRVSVIDAGPGMTPAEASCAFEKYWRATGARPREGTGLGLYVARRIIEEHGGMMGVDSVRNIGSRFFFELPVS